MKKTNMQKVTDSVKRIVDDTEAQILRMSSPMRYEKRSGGNDDFDDYVNRCGCE